MSKPFGPIVSFADLPSMEVFLAGNDTDHLGFWLKLSNSSRLPHRLDLLSGTKTGKPPTA